MDATTAPTDPLNRLPPEILAHIFKRYLPMADRLNLFRLRNPRIIQILYSSVAWPGANVPNLTGFLDLLHEPLADCFGVRYDPKLHCCFHVELSLRTSRSVHNRVLITAFSALPDFKARTLSSPGLTRPSLDRLREYLLRSTIPVDPYPLFYRSTRGHTVFAERGKRHIIVVAGDGTGPRYLPYHVPIRSVSGMATLHLDKGSRQFVYVFAPFAEMQFLRRNKSNSERLVLQYRPVRNTFAQREEPTQTLLFFR